MQCTVRLDHAAVNSVRSHVVRLVGEPNALPLLQHQSEVFRRVDQLLSPTFLDGRVNGNDATSGAQTHKQHRSTNPASHRSSSVNLQAGRAERQLSRRVNYVLAKRNRDPMRISSVRRAGRVVLVLTVVAVSRKAGTRWQ